MRYNLNDIGHYTTYPCNTTVLLLLSSLFHVIGPVHNYRSRKQIALKE
jgi:hypothetical protein